MFTAFFIKLIKLLFLLNGGPKQLTLSVMTKEAIGANPRVHIWIITPVFDEEPGAFAAS